MHFILLNDLYLDYLMLHIELQTVESCAKQIYRWNGGSCIVIDTTSKLSRPVSVGQQNDVPEIPRERFFELLSPA